MRIHVLPRSISCLGLSLLPWQFSAACFLLRPHMSSSSKGGDPVWSISKTLMCLDIKSGRCTSLMVIACLRGESICTANGHLHNPISLYWLISTVGLPQGAGGEELGNINRKMTSSKRAPFSTYCWLASWFRADKQIWPESCCSIWWWHQQSRTGNISRGGRCGCEPCHPLPAALAAGACTLWQKPRAKLIVINFDYRPFPLKWLSRWICPMRALKGKLLTSASANASSRFISDIFFFSFSNWFLVQIQTLCINSLQGFYAIFLGFRVALWKTWKHYGNDQGQFLCSLFKYQLAKKTCDA